MNNAFLHTPGTVVLQAPDAINLTWDSSARFEASDPKADYSKWVHPSQVANSGRSVIESAPGTCPAAKSAAGRTSTTAAPSATSRNTSTALSGSSLAVCAQTFGPCVDVAVLALDLACSRELRSALAGELPPGRGTSAHRSG